MATRKTSTTKSSKAAKPVEPAEDKAAKPVEQTDSKAAEPAEAVDGKAAKPVEAVDVIAGSAGKHPNEAIIAKVKKRFRDKDTLSTFQPGATIAVSPERFEEICAAGDFLERIQ